MRIRMLVAAGTLVLTGLFGQTPTATIVGTVYDSSRGLVPAAALEIVNTETGDVRKTESDSKGEFVVPNLMPGLTRSPSPNPASAPESKTGWFWN